MVRVCSDCKNTALGGKYCRACGGLMVDAGDRSQRETLEGVGVSIRALYAARAAMVLFWTGFVFGVMFSLGFVRRAYGAETAMETGMWWVAAVAGLFIVWGVFWGIGNVHYRRTLAANKKATGLTGAEERFFGGVSDIST